MKNIKNKRILAVVATVLVAGTAFFASCEKEDEVKVDSKNDTTIIEENEAGIIDIVTIQLGKKKKNEFGIGYYCSGLKGICVLFFGGLFTFEPMDFMPEEPCPYASLKLNDNNTLGMTMYFGKATEEEQAAILEDISDGDISVSEDVFIDHEDLLEHWNMSNPILLTPGNYTVKDYDPVGSSFNLTIPYTTLED